MPQFLRSRRVRPSWLTCLSASLLTLIFVLSACATTGQKPDEATAAAAKVAAAQKPDPSGLKPFKEIVKDARETKGYFSIWQKDDKVWIEVPAERFDQPFFFSVNISDSVGERMAYAGMMGDSYVASLHRIGNSVQLLAKNTDFRADAGSAIERAVRQSFSDSLLSVATVVSLPEPERKSVLIDANALLFGDIPGYSTLLETAFHIPYQLDRGNTSFVKTRADAGIASFGVRAHFSINRLSGLVVPQNPFPPTPPSTIPDARSLFVAFVYSFMPLPAEPMKARNADDRVGYFVETVSDFTRDTAPTPRINLVHRWRLDKKDPAAPLSEPVRPIVYWVDKNVPERYRQAVIDGILEWNKAFERIGFKNAIEARVQPDDADWDNLDARHASVRWFLGADVGFAIGPSQVDPRSGEILDADIGISDVFARLARARVTDEITPRKLPALPSGRHDHDHDDDAGFAAGAVNEAGFAFDLLDARGSLPADGPEADALANAYLKSIVMHEVGHTLGLRHNFRASTVRTPAQLANASYTREHGLSGSIMDYVPFNIALPDEPQGEYVMSTLGPYDYWAIEYGYRPLAPEVEAAELARIAARNTEPDLAYATDEDASSGVAGMDPDSNLFDLGSEPLTYYRKRFALTRELWQRLATRPMKPDEDYLVLRRNVERGFAEIGRAAPLAAKYVGGMRVNRDHAGTGRNLVVPVPAGEQKQALELLTGQLFSADSFRFDPDFIARLGIDQFDRRGAIGNRFDLAARLLAIQRGVLDQLLSEPVAARLMDGALKTRQPRQLLSLAQLYETLQNAIWSELKSGADIDRLRRNLQREHLRLLGAVLLKPSNGGLSDIKSLQRDNAVALRKSLQAVLARSGNGSRLSHESVAHLRESLSLLDEMLKANFKKEAA